MEKSLEKGDVIIMPFPFSDLSSAKNRPVLVIANIEGEDIIVCQITSKERNDKYSIMLYENEFKEGNLNTTSTIRPNRLFTADKKKILYKVGKLKEFKIKEVQNKLIDILTA